MIALPSGTVTFLFTDIEGSTTRWEQQRAAMQAALARHDAILREAIEGHGGHVFKTVGDAFYAVFATAPTALEAALAAQRALQDETWDAAVG
ncbi:MAG TPA: adenylate/guanylate cyclase domain-containing protein, partial [Herpetosiphonaceae bacterium]|nr:adenylate/guanylate cyclase domain-containing protein [Herpetosiphonaceae bacterium]